MIRDFEVSDSADVCEIYNHYIIHSHHTFETEPISVEEMKKRIETVMKEYPFLVFENNKKIIAYAYASKWKERQAYNQTAESTIYLK